MRPQSAALGPSKEAGDLKASGKKLRDGSPTQTAMRSSFYGMSLLDDEEKAELEANDLTAKTKYEAEQERRGAVLNQLNITNILELSQKEKEVLNQIKKFMKQQESELQNEIQVMQRLMMEQATQKQSDSEESDQEDDVVTQSDLKEYSKKLKVVVSLDKEIKFLCLSTTIRNLNFYHW